ncbi:nucleotide exchange factor GrpE [Falsarthrobacter nasiphocae]|uniref:Protein GrpE n=1 Tax=Falsarthrobacter nasiphocae TaxID=189863 RepID=A0AAE3YF80_9MICC|nr:nucleotide exchange factor GrpE [Falsarthrobacter nasiphocae]MDR6892304.1 molecular chaperone GrpE [Falsarthrobacter nasiphocae]
MPHHGNEAEHENPVTPEGSAAGSESGAEYSAPEGTAGENTEGDALDQVEDILNSASLEDESTDAPASEAPANDEAAELRSDLLRLQAEYVNYRKRVERDRAVAGENATIAALQALLPVLDDIEAARQHGDLEEGPFASISKKLDAALAGLGLESINETGVPFDPNVHEALMQVPNPEVPEDHVAQILRVGYRKGERVLRAAQVIVSTGE